jgi:outer membrane protein
MNAEVNHSARAVPRLLLLAALAASLTCAAQAADLLQVYQQALANDAQYASARAALAAGMERVPQGRAGLLPTVSVTGSNTRGNTDTDVAALGGANIDRHTNTYSLSLSQPLLRWANWQQYQQSKLAQSIAEAQFAQAQQDLIARVAQAYFDVLTAQDNLGVTRAQKEATTEQLASAKRNFEVGTQTITDTHEAQAAYDLVLAQELAAINDLDNRRGALQAIIGQLPPELAPLRVGVTLATLEPATLEAWIGAAERQNYGVVAAQLAHETARRAIALNRAGHYPTLDLVANAGHTYATAYGKTNTNAIGVQWSVPLFSGFAVDSRVRESIALEERARADLETARRNASLGARQAYLGVNSGLAQVRALQAAEVSSKSALESNKLGYQVGVRINIDVLNAQKQLFSTQKDLSKARYDTIMNGLRLKSAAGTLSDADLLPVNDLLQK